MIAFGAYQSPRVYRRISHLDLDTQNGFLMFSNLWIACIFMQSHALFCVEYSITYDNHIDQTGLGGLKQVYLMVQTCEILVCCSLPKER